MEVLNLEDTVGSNITQDVYFRVLVLGDSGGAAPLLNLSF